MSLRNRAVVYQGVGKVSVCDVDYPSFQLNAPEQKRLCPHAVILKLIATNICGSDLHMVRGRAPFREGQQLGHELTGEVVEVGPAVEFLEVGDIVVSPFNICCGKCWSCRMGKTNICLNANPQMPGAAYGYSMMGGWEGGQAEYCMCPWADFNLVKLEKKSSAMDRIHDVCLLSDVLPTAYHACVAGNVSTGSSVYIAGAGPIGLAAAACSLQLLGAGTVMVSDFNADRLKLAHAMGCETILLPVDESDKTLTGKAVSVVKTMLGMPNIAQKIESILGEKYVDCALDCAGFETNGHAAHHRSVVEKAEAVNDCFRFVRAGGTVSVPGVYMPMDLGGDTMESKAGKLMLDWGTMWSKCCSVATGQTPCLRHMHGLTRAVMSDHLHVAEFLNISTIPLDEAPNAYKRFNEGEARKFVIDPHGSITRSAKAFHEQRKRKVEDLAQSLQEGA